MQWAVEDCNDAEGRDGALICDLQWRPAASQQGEHAAPDKGDIAPEIKSINSLKKKSY